LRTPNFSQSQPSLAAPNSAGPASTPSPTSLPRHSIRPRQHEFAQAHWSTPASSDAALGIQKELGKHCMETIVVGTPVGGTGAPPKIVSMQCFPSSF
ncbi:MAG: hypothetical protein Q9206_000646, partial [Seirophora lacunosa]